MAQKIRPKNVPTVHGSNGSVLDFLIFPFGDAQWTSKFFFSGLCFAPRVRVLLILKIHQENKVLGVNQFFELVYSASFLSRTR